MSIRELRKEHAKLQAEHCKLRDWQAEVTVALQREGGAHYADVPKHIRALVAELLSAKAIVPVLFRQVRYRPDHACGKCIANTDISRDLEVPGFECAYHRAERIIFGQQEPKQDG